jgi:hypothetical protein
VSLDLNRDKFKDIKREMKFSSPVQKSVPEKKDKNILQFQKSVINLTGWLNYAVNLFG